MDNNFVLSNLQVCVENQILKNASVEVRDRVIHAIDAGVSSAKNAIQFPQNYFLVPGFIDLHVHGADGADVMDATSDAFTTMSAALAREGTTGFLATTMTASLQDIERSLCAARAFMQESKKVGAQLLGVHLEGPFLSAKKIGAQSLDALLTPKIEYIEHWQKISDDVIKLVTLAPELPGSLEFIQLLRQKNIVASLGHTDATYAQTVAAIEAGCTHATHLFNAMRGMHQREPGAVTAALLSEKVMGELIVDGVHLHPAIVELCLKLKGKNQIALVTDSMRAKCLQDGKYDLGGQVVDVKNNVAKLQDGTLAGSVLKMASAIQNFMQYTNCGLEDAVRMASLNPARVLGLSERKGSIAVGKDADLVVLNDRYEVVMTICGGYVAFSSLTLSSLRTEVPSLRTK